MIIDRLDRADKYYLMNPFFQKAFEFIKNNDLLSFEIGTYEIDGENSYIIIAEDNSESIVPDILETHSKYIDIQLPLINSFPIKWKALEDCKLINEPYNEDRDVAFFNDKADFEFLLYASNFAILFPEDAHFAQAPTSYLKKAIVKVKVLID